MGFFTDILSGGGNLYRQVVPREIRNAVPKEISPGGFNPGRDWLGVDLDGSLAKEAAAKQAAQQAQQASMYDQQFAQSANAPIPGLLGMSNPQGPMIAGLLAQHQPGLNQVQDRQQGATPTPFQPMGPYGMQAAQMAGLLGNRGFVDPRMDPNNPKYMPNPRNRPPGK